jgi:sulfopyruvate decarboxylase subunit alpha
MTITRFSVPASALVGQLRACKVTHFVTMPDYVQIALNHHLVDGALRGVTIVNCSTEDEAVAISLGLHIGGAVPFLSMQNQGLFACANALLSVGVNASTPLPILAGQWGRELENLGHDPSESRRLVVRRTEPLLDALEIPHFRIESAEEVGNVRRAFETSHELGRPSVALIGAHVSWS